MTPTKPATDVPAALIHLADVLRKSAANDNHQASRAVMDRVAGTLRAIAILTKADA